MEEAVCTGCDSLITIYATWTDYADRRGKLTVLVVHTLHDAGLYTRCVRTQKDVLGYIVGML